MPTIVSPPPVEDSRQEEDYSHAREETSQPLIDPGQYEDEDTPPAAQPRLHHYEEPVLHREPPPPTFVAPPPPAVAPLEPPNESLLSKYAEAQAEIERLRTMLASYAADNNVGLRKRSVRSAEKSAEDEEGPEPGQETRLADNSETGVPPLIVIMIALGVFVTTYLFF